MGEEIIMTRELVLGKCQSFSARNFQEALLFEKETIDGRVEKKLS